MFPPAFDMESPTFLSNITGNNPTNMKALASKVPSQNGKTNHKIHKSTKKKKKRRKKTNLV